jgi:lysozyme
MFEYQGKISWVDVDTLKINIPYTLFSSGPPGMTDWTSNLIKLAWRQKNNLIRELYHYYRPNENSLEQAALLLKRFL